MSNIKYRCWSKLEKEYRPLKGIRFSGGHVWGDIEYRDSNNSQPCHPDIGGETIVLEQWTGWLDNSGNMVYEGDLIRDEKHKALGELSMWEGRWQIVFTSGVCGIPTGVGVEIPDSHTYWAEHRAVVVGNIHEGVKEEKKPTLEERVIMLEREVAPLC